MACLFQVNYLLGLRMFSKQPIATFLPRTYFYILGDGIVIKLQSHPCYIPNAEISIIQLNLLRRPQNFQSRFIFFNKIISSSCYWQYVEKLCSHFLIWNENLANVFPSFIRRNDFRSIWFPRGIFVTFSLAKFKAP